MWKFLVLFGLITVCQCGKLVQNECGKVKIVTQGLIVGGYNSIQGQWPWHAAIFHVNNYRLDYACGGTLIDEYRVVTAAHCVIEGNSGYLFSTESVIVRVGLYDLTYSSRNTQTHKVLRLHMHEQFAQENNMNDIAIITLATKVGFTEYIQPACIYPSSNFNTFRSQGLVGTAIGWGMTEARNISPTIRAVTLPIVGFFDCLSSNRPFYGNVLSDTMFCAGRKNGSTVCNGDSGGGIFIKESETWYLIGLASFTSFQKEQVGICSQQDYAVFVDVPKYWNWIENDISHNEPLPPKLSEKKCQEYSKKFGTPNDFNFVSLYGRKIGMQIQWNCHAVMISERFALASADDECFTLSAKPSILGIQHNDQTEKSKCRFEIVETIIHPQLQKVALFRLNRDVDSECGLKIACLWTNNNVNAVHAVRIYDYFTSYVAESTRILGDNVCWETLASNETVYTHPNSYLCTTSYSAEDQECMSSNSLVGKMAGEDFYRIIGVPFGVINCKTEVYIKIPDILNWIESIVWPNTTSTDKVNK